MITSYKETNYKDRKIINFVVDEIHYTKEVFDDGHCLYWGCDFHNSEAYLIDNGYEKELETILKLYQREQKLNRII